jgi:hypothetical protein
MNVGGKKNLPAFKPVLNWFQTGFKLVSNRFLPDENPVAV